MWVQADEVDLVSGLLWGAGVSAVAEHPEPDGSVRLRADLPRGGVDALRSGLGQSWPVEVVDVVDDGLDAWRAHATVVRAGRRLVVRPPWLDLPDHLPGDAVVLEIDPGASFGHGAHPTTRLCLAMIEDVLGGRGETSVLDVGCGSGVLSVAAARLGATSVLAVDIDPVAVAVTRDNAERNGVGAQVAARLVSEPGPAASDPLADLDAHFDVVVANIGAGALVGLAPALSARLAERGAVILAGLLDPPPAEVSAAFAPHLVEVTRSADDGWTALQLARP